MNFESGLESYPINKIGHWKFKVSSIGENTLVMLANGKLMYFSIKYFGSKVEAHNWLIYMTGGQDDSE